MSGTETEAMAVTVSVTESETVTVAETETADVPETEAVSEGGPPCPPSLPVLHDVPGGEDHGW